MSKRIQKLQELHAGKFPIVVIENAFSREECDSLISLYNGDKEREIKDVLPGKEGKQTNFVEVYQSECVDWMYDRLEMLVEKANEENFKFDPKLYHDITCAFINKYSSAEDGHRGWHVDGVLTEVPGYATRKLSVVVQLSDDHDYEGGDLELFAYHNPKGVDLRKKGTAFVFPAFEWHRITDVTKGDRYSLVHFVHGVPFK